MNCVIYFLGEQSILAEAQGGKFDLVKVERKSNWRTEGINKISLAELRLQVDKVN